MAPGRRQSSLWRVVSRPPQQAPHRKSQRAGEVVGLVESACQGPVRMEGHGHDRIDARQHIGARAAHQRPERRSQRAAFFVLERVHNRAQRSLVAAGAARQRE